MDDIYSNSLFNLSSPIKASLILCTYNRSEKLYVFLQKISLLQSSHPIEIILIDNNSSDDTKRLLDEFVITCKFPACSATEKRKGTGYGRNTGASLSRGEYQIYIDDDCYPDSSFIDEHVKLLDEEPHLGFVGGRVELFDKNDLPITILTLKEPRRFPTNSRLLAGDVISANMCVRKCAFDSVSGWDNLFGAGTSFPCEDLDIAARILASGWEGLYHPSPLVYHHHERKTLAEANMLMKSYDAGRGGFYAKALMTKSLRSIYIWPWIKYFAKRPATQTLREIHFFFRYILTYKK